MALTGTLGPTSHGSGQESKDTLGRYVHFRREGAKTIISSGRGTMYRCTYLLCGGQRIYKAWYRQAPPKRADPHMYLYMFLQPSPSTSRTGNLERNREM